MQERHEVLKFYLRKNEAKLSAREVIEVKEGNGDNDLPLFCILLEPVFPKADCINSVLSVLMSASACQHNLL